MEEKLKAIEDARKQIEHIDEVKDKTEIFSRVVGYIRPLANFNPGKMSEWKERVFFDETLKKLN